MDFLIKKGKVDVKMVKCLQVYFILSQDNFILVDAISMWDMSFVLSHSFTTDANAPLLFEMYVSLNGAAALDQVEWSVTT